MEAETKSTSTIIAAQPGYKLLIAHPEGSIEEEPIIAWRIYVDEDDEDADVVLPITDCGYGRQLDFDDEQAVEFVLEAIERPDGTVFLPDQIDSGDGEYTNREEWLEQIPFPKTEEPQNTA